MKCAKIDLRSDTMTQPTPAMRKAMASAEVGDDVYGEDPSVNRLQERAAEIFGREAALFLPSGTMANQIAIKIYTKPGQEVVCEERAHVYTSELGMMAVFSGCMAHPVWSEDGILTWNAIEPQIRSTSGKYGGTSLVSIENTANFAGGTVYTVSATSDICIKARQRGIPVHLDGARIFNAACVLGVNVSDLTQETDSLMFSLSKGLGAPAGSILLGTAEFIAEARHLKKMLGGGMRQVGILAAAGLIALNEAPKGLELDHENARLIAEGLAELSSLHLVSKVVTNIVVVEVSDTRLDSKEVVSRLATAGVLANPINARAFRLVTHRDVSRADCEQAVKIIRHVLSSQLDAAT
jgi:threonine aldolase